LNYLYLTLLKFLLGLLYYLNFLFHFFIDLKAFESFLKYPFFYLIFILNLNCPLYNFSFGQKNYLNLQKELFLYDCLLLLFIFFSSKILSFLILNHVPLQKTPNLMCLFKKMGYLIRVLKNLIFLKSLYIPIICYCLLILLFLIIIISNINLHLLIYLKF
jgi:hypothetical protein